MSDKPASNNSTAAWIISIVAALVLYVLSDGPIWALVDNGKLPPSWQPVVWKVYWPIDRLCEYVSADRAMQSYYWWWRKRLE